MLLISPSPDRLQVTTAKRLLDGVVQKEEKAEKEERATAAVVREKAGSLLT